MYLSKARNSKQLRKEKRSAQFPQLRHAVLGPTEQLGGSLLPRFCCRVSKAYSKPRDLDRLSILFACGNGWKGWSRRHSTSQGTCSNASRCRPLACRDLLFTGEAKKHKSASIPGDPPTPAFGASAQCSHHFSSSQLDSSLPLRSRHGSPIQLTSGGFCETALLLGHGSLVQPDLRPPRAAPPFPTLAATAPNFFCPQ